LASSPSRSTQHPSAAERRDRSSWRFASNFESGVKQLSGQKVLARGAHLPKCFILSPPSFAGRRILAVVLSDQRSTHKFLRCFVEFSQRGCDFLRQGGRDPAPAGSAPGGVARCRCGKRGVYIQNNTCAPCGRKSPEQDSSLRSE
jgi:hypothetical protein